MNSAKDDVNHETASTSSRDSGVPHAKRAWEHWRRLGSPKFLVAPMVDQSELPFRQLCRKYGATAAYTPMLHARLFAEKKAYREEHFTTCEGDRPLFVQFCANDEEILVQAAKHVEKQCDYVDLNFGCPQRIAKRGNYGAFLMDDLPKVEALVRALHENLETPVSAKIRIFPDLDKTLEYAKMIERAGASLLAVHGRTRDQKKARNFRADWDAIKAVKAALSIPVLGNGDVRNRHDALRLMEYTGVDGVLSAEPLLDDPALFWEERAAGRPYTHLERFGLASEYLAMCEQYPTPARMVRGHLHKILGPWLSEHTAIRDRFCQQRMLTVPFCKEVVAELEAAVAAVGRDHPVPTLSERALARIAREEALAAAIQEQAREESAVAALDTERAAAAAAREGGGLSAATAAGDGKADGAPEHGGTGPGAGAQGGASVESGSAALRRENGGVPEMGGRGGEEGGPPRKQQKVSAAVAATG